MAFGYILAAAQAGMSLFQARESIKAAGAQAAATIGSATYSGMMERYQLTQRARYEGSMRAQEFARTVGAQRAAMSSAGIIGGRTQALVQAQAQAGYARDVGQADLQTQAQVAASQYRQQSAITAARTGMKQDIRQAQTTAFSGLLRAGTQAFDIFQARQAQTKPTTSSTGG